MIIYRKLYALIFVLMILVFTTSIDAGEYTSLDIGVPDSLFRNVSIIDLNNNGQLIGFGRSFSTGKQKYFILTSENGVWNRDNNADGANDFMTEIVMPPEYSNIQIRAMNDSGQVVGYMRVIATGGLVGFMWENGVFTFLPKPANSIAFGWNWATDINNSGQIVGGMSVYFDQAPAIQEGFMWDNGEATQLGEDFSVNYLGVGTIYINDNGVAAGNGSESGGIFWQNGVTTNLTSLGGTSTSCLGLNNIGQFIGGATYPDGSEEFVIWENNIPQITSPIFPTKINNKGQYLGIDFIPNDHILWLPEPAYDFDAGMYYLDSLIPQTVGFSLRGYADINDSGIIAVHGRFGISRNTAWVMIPVPPPTITVNSIGDAVDINPGDGICYTGNTIAGGDPECTMRAALMESNALADNVFIEFDIPGIPTIQPNSPLPEITDTVYISGFTQPGNDPVLLDGINAGNVVDGLKVSSDNIIVEGIYIGRFDGNGMLLLIAENCEIRGCTIGYTNNSSIDFGNGFNGISLVASSHNTIGGISSWMKNNISNNKLDGISVTGVSIANDIVSNNIGKGLTGNELGNSGNGIYIGQNADSNLIGAFDLFGDGNFIRGNGENGIHLEYTNYGRVIANEIIENKNSGLVLDNFCFYTEVFGNYIGIADDTSPAGNLKNGIEIVFFSDSNYIGEDFLAGNTIMHNGASGILLKQSSHNRIKKNIVASNSSNGMHLDSTSLYNFFSNNNIGIDYDDLEAGNLNGGIYITHNSSGNFIGDGNIIKFNLTEGVYINHSDNNIIRGNIISSNYGTGLIIDSTSNYNSVKRNKIGIDSSGVAAGNSKYGVAIINHSDSNFIGGTKLNGNVISNNLFSGILIDSSDYNQIQGNTIGLDSTGLIAMGNKLDGVTIVSSIATVVGIGTDVDSNLTGAGNLISANASSGIKISNKSWDSWLNSNLIGCGIDTVEILPNFRGVSVFDSPNTLIGGTGFFDEYLGNIIYTNLETGIWIESDWSTLYGNYIWSNGFDVVSGNQAINGAGVYVKGNNNIIGGDIALIANNIIGNNGVGVFIDTISGDLDDYNYIRYNWISENLHGGIDLFPIGPNPNDTLDADGGANAGQNKPLILTSLLTGSGQVVVTGTLSSEPNQKYFIDFYGNVECDSLGLGQGDYWLSGDTIQTDNFGFATFYTVSNVINGTPPNFITSTVMNFYNNNTSEFSNCNAVVMQSSGVDLFVEKTDNVDSLLYSDTVTYEIIVTNIGSDDATSVIMRDSLPSQLIYISDSTTLGICTELDGIIQCNLGTMTSGTTATILIKALAIDSGQIENVAIVGATEVDIQLLNNSSTDTTLVVTKIPTDIDDDVENSLPTKFALFQNYPNPFNPSTEISFSVPTRSYVTIEIFNIVGQKIKTLLDTQLSAGSHSITWNGNDASGNQIASGIYLYRISSEDFVDTKKMLLLK